jgi:hypothetical protein
MTMIIDSVVLVGAGAVVAGIIEVESSAEDQKKEAQAAKPMPQDDITTKQD